MIVNVSTDTATFQVATVTTRTPLLPIGEVAWLHDDEMGCNRSVSKATESVTRNPDEGVS